MEKLNKKLKTIIEKHSMKFIKRIFIFSIVFITIVHHSTIALTASSTQNFSKETIIDKTFAFPLSKIVTRFKKDHNVNDSDVTLYEKELRRFLILCALYPQENVGMYSKPVDELWHTFITYTKEYKQFCKEVAGRFIHHVPNENDLQSNDSQPSDYTTFARYYQMTFNEAPSKHVWNNQKDCTGGGG